MAIIIGKKHGNSCGVSPKPDDMMDWFMFRKSFTGKPEFLAPFFLGRSSDSMKQPILGGLLATHPRHGGSEFPKIMARLIIETHPKAWVLESRWRFSSHDPPSSTISDVPPQALLSLLLGKKQYATFEVVCSIVATGLCWCFMGFIQN